MGRVATGATAAGALVLLGCAVWALSNRDQAARGRPALVPPAVRAAVGLAAPHVDARSAVVLDGLVFRVLAWQSRSALPLPGGETLHPAGEFEIVKLRISNISGRERLLQPSLVNLDIGGALHVAAPSAATLLRGSRWQPLHVRGLQAGSSAVRKVFYDVPAQASGRSMMLRIGSLDSRRPVATVALTAGARAP